MVTVVRGRGVVLARGVSCWLWRATVIPAVRAACRGLARVIGAGLAHLFDDDATAASPRGWRAREPGSSAS